MISVRPSEAQVFYFFIWYWHCSFLDAIDEDDKYLSDFLSFTQLYHFQWLRLAFKVISDVKRSKSGNCWSRYGVIRLRSNCVWLLSASYWSRNYYFFFFNFHLIQASDWHFSWIHNNTTLDFFSRPLFKRSVCILLYGSIILLRVC